MHDDSVDLICAHPPYADIFHYGEDIEKDLSFLLITGDMRKKGMVRPLAFETMHIGSSCRKRRMSSQGVRGQGVAGSHHGRTRCFLPEKIFFLRGLCVCGIAIAREMWYTITVIRQGERDETDNVCRAEL